MLVDVKDSTPAVDVPVQKRTSAAREAEMWLNGQLARGRLETFVVKHTLTPELAQLLIVRNDENRRIRERVIAAYAADMTEGHWEENGETIIVSRDGMLNDGQHRCLAVMRSGVSIPAAFAFGVSRESRLSVDQGVKRRTADYFSMAGEKNATGLAHAAKLLWLYLEKGNLNASTNGQITSAQQRDIVERFPDLRFSIDRAEVRGGARPLGGIGLMAFCHFVIARTTKDEEAVERFFQGLLDGVGLELGDPIFMARNRLESEKKNRVSHQLRAEVVFRAWNMFRKGDRKTKIQTSGNLPRLER